MELFITVASLATAIYAVASRERQLDLKLRFGALDACVIGVLFLLTFYMQFYGFAEAQKMAFAQSRWPKGLNPQNATSLTVIAAVGWVIYRIRTARFTAKNVFEFQELTEELFWAGRFGELLTLIEAHACELFRASQSDFPLANLARRLNPPPTFESQMRRFTKGGETRKTSQESRYKRIATAVMRRIGSGLPTYAREAEAANDIIRSVLLARPFIHAIATSRPYAALNILRNWPEINRNEFVSLYLRELAQNTAGIFYIELERNQGMSHQGYEIPASNRLLHFLLSDAKFAEQLRLYKPIGDFAEWHLDELGRHPEDDLYNRAPGGFDDEEMHSWPLYASIRFFDIMVTQALYQGIEWHMWLYYFPALVKRMVRNYRQGGQVSSPGAEFPLRYSRLLYEVFDVLRGWTLAIEYLPITQKNIVLEHTRPTHENGNIPKSSILALGMCLRDVLECDKICDSEKHMLTDMAMSLYFDLRGIQRDDYASTAAEAIKAGGISYRREDALYRKQIQDHFRQEETEYRIKYQDQWVRDLGSVLGCPSEC